MVVNWSLAGAPGSESHFRGAEAARGPLDDKTRPFEFFKIGFEHIRDILVYGM